MLVLLIGPASSHEDAHPKLLAVLRGPEEPILTHV